MSRIIGWPSVYELHRDAQSAAFLYAQRTGKDWGGCLCGTGRAHAYYLAFHRRALREQGGPLNTHVRASEALIALASRVMTVIDDMTPRT